MTTSDWIALGGITITLLTAIIGSAFILASKIGATLTDIKVTIAPMQVKVDALWHHHLSELSSRGELRVDKSDT